MIITPQDLKRILPNCRDPQTWANVLSAVLTERGIEDKTKVAQFIAQTSHESADYSVLVENLNYSADGLLRVFKKYFTPQTAAQCARKPEQIANRVYANRMGNGPESSGDGWRYRGRGAIQLTGKNNYRACSIALFGNENLLTDPGYLCTPEGAIRSAVWFWQVNNVGALADDVRATTLKINGGTHGLDDRAARFARALDVLNA